ncbi:protein kinase 2 [Stylonychia lemnae]|uniref:non-specific serine/threonine protein kinase n=1 Tax=Stylonychia lemnae TaxID=5949 RepID=A0A077ZUI6_STYLE|nr:protein kinase 2 [Stylonychia lemnae]|eukprot:CDW73224.1 protein kinase 2 [Stylonychia lemnae]
MGNKTALCSQRQKSQFFDESISTNSTQSSLKPKCGNRGVSKDDFQILKVIGRGSFGKVFLVKKRKSGQLFAMKVLKKHDVLKRNQIEHTKAERQILQHVTSPFLVNMHYAFQTEEKLYMVMDFMNGGELFYHLNKERTFNEDRIRYHVAEIVLAVESLHKAGIIYRDLKPENILLDSEGHVRLTDFGLSKQGIFRDQENQAFTICGTPEYLAPEIIRGEGHGPAVDWWSLGALVFEMYTSRPPFQNMNKMQLLYTIATKKIDFSDIENASADFQNLVKRLLQRNPEKRIGGGEQDADEIKRHPFFNGLDWDAMSRKEVAVVFKPETSDSKDTRNIHSQFLNERAVDSPCQTRFTESQRAKLVFDQFTYTKDQDFYLTTTIGTD